MLSQAAECTTLTLLNCRKKWLLFPVGMFPTILFLNRVEWEPYLHAHCSKYLCIAGTVLPQRLAFGKVVVCFGC